MSSLGSFGTKKEAHEHTFDYFGETIRVHPQLSSMALMDFMRRARTIELPDPEDDEAAFRTAILGQLPFIEEFVTFEIHPDDRDLFWKTSVANGQEPQDLLTTAMGVMAAVAEHPTGRPSASSAGRSRMKRNSAANSSLQGGKGRSSRVKKRLEAQGRPDWALIVLEEQEAQAARSA